MFSSPKYKYEAIIIELGRNRCNSVSPPVNLNPRQSPVLEPCPAMNPDVRKLYARNVHTHGKNLMNGLAAAVATGLAGKRLVLELIRVDQGHPSVPKLLKLERERERDGECVCVCVCVCVCTSASESASESATRARIKANPIIIGVTQTPRRTK